MVFVGIIELVAVVAKPNGEGCLLANTLSSFDESLSDRSEISGGPITFLAGFDDDSPDIFETTVSFISSIFFRVLAAG